MIPLKNLGAWSKICPFTAFEESGFADGRTIMEAEEQTLVTVSHQTLCKCLVEMCTWISFHRLQQIQEFHFQLKYKEQTMDTCPDCSTFSADLLTVHKYCTITVIFNYKKKESCMLRKIIQGSSEVFHLSSMYFRKSSHLAKGQSPAILLFSPSPSDMC